MPFQVIVREIKPRQNAEPGTAATSSEQIYEQQVDWLDLGKLIAAVNHKPRLRKTKGAATAQP
jgi:hypothetical protein